MIKFIDPIVKEDMQRISSADLRKYYGKRVLITGVGGMLARYIAYALLYENDTHGAGIMITGLARNRKKAEEKFSDILKREDFSLLFADVTEEFGGEYDFIFHLAGDASAVAIATVPEQIVMTNVLGTRNVLELAKKNSATVFFASTREIYGKTEENVLLEESCGTLDPTKSRSCYPESKKMAENLCSIYHEKYSVPVCIARIAHSYGPGMQLENDGRVMADLLACAGRGEDIALTSDGSAKRAFCYISDAVSAIFTGMNATGDGLQVFNIANENEEISILELARLIANINGRIGVTHRDPDLKLAGAYFNIPRVKLSTEKLEALGWKPQISLPEGIRRTMESFS